MVAAEALDSRLSAAPLCETMGQALQSVCGEAALLSFPLACGGAGTVQVLQTAAQGVWIPETVTGLQLNRPVEIAQRFPQLSEACLGTAFQAVRNSVTVIHSDCFVVQSHAVLKLSQPFVRVSAMQKQGVRGGLYCLDAFPDGALFQCRPVPVGGDSTSMRTAASMSPA